MLGAHLALWPLHKLHSAGQCQEEGSTTQPDHEGSYLQAKKCEFGWGSHRKPSQDFKQTSDKGKPLGAMRKVDWEGEGEVSLLESGRPM